MTRRRPARENIAQATPGRRRDQALTIDAIDRLETITIRRLVILHAQLEAGNAANVATFRRQQEARFIRRLGVLRELRDALVSQALQESEAATGIASDLRIKIKPLPPSADLESDETAAREELRGMLGAGQADAEAG
jgi:hypothetical protein